MILPTEVILATRTQPSGSLCLWQCFLQFNSPLCTTTKYSSRLLQSVPHDFSTMFVVFDRTVDVARSSFSISEQTFLTRLGGSVSSGRTLLWILVTMLGAAQVVNIVDFKHWFRDCFSWYVKFGQETFLGRSRWSGLRTKVQLAPFKTVFNHMSSKVENQYHDSIFIDIKL